MPARVQVVTTGYNGSPGYNTFVTGESDPVEIAAWAVDVDTLWDELESVLANGTVWTRSGQIEVFNPSNGQTIGLVSGSPSSGIGTWGTAKAPGGTALLLQWRTGEYVNGREVRGRSFLSGIGDFGDTTGAVPTSIITDVQNAMDNYLSNTNGASVYSPTAGDTYAIASGNCWNKFGLIRSRRD